jgi:hypothetical protein
VRPAMKPTMGLLRPRLASSDELGRFFFGRAADFADHDDRLGGFVGQEQLQDVDELGALDRVAADADGRGLAEAGVGGLEHGFIGQGARARDDADRAFEKIEPGMMPILHWFGVRTPGQFGPIRRDLLPCRAFFTRTMSSTGMPSVMQMISGISASMASRIESAAKGGGT